MNTKTYLNQISRLDKMIQNKLSEIYRLKTIACSVTVSTDKEAVDVSSDKDKLGSTVTKIVDLEKDTDRLVDEFMRKRNHIIKTVSIRLNRLQVGLLQLVQMNLLLTHRLLQKI